MSRPSWWIGASRPLRLAVRAAGSTPYGVLTALLLIPTACFLLLPFFPATFGLGQSISGVAAFRHAYQGYVTTALFNSVWVGLAASALALVAAVGLAWLCERHQVRGAGAWRTAVWLLLLVPTYLSALGFEYLLAPQGVIAQATGWYPASLDHLLLGPAGVVLVLTLRAVAFSYFAVAGVVRSMGNSPGDAARVHGLPRWRTALVQVGSLTPALMAGFVLAFAETISDFGVASTLAADAHFPVITYTIFTFTDAIPIDFAAAAAISWSLIAVFIGVLLLQRFILGGRDYAATGDHPPAGSRPLPTLTQRVAPFAIGAFFVVALAGPAIGIVVSSLLGGTASSGGAVASAAGLSLAAYRALFDNPSQLSPIWLSVRLSVVGATLATAVGLAVNLWGQHRGKTRGAALVDLGLVAVIGLPSVVLGAGFVFFYNLPVVYRIVPVYDTQWLLLVGYVVGFAPIAIRMLSGPLAQAGRERYYAGRVHGGAPLRAWTRAVLPHIARPLVSIWLFLVAIIMFELPLSEVLHAPSGEPVAVAVAVKFKSQVATGTALTVVAIAVTLALLGAVTALQVLARSLSRRRNARREAELSAWIAQLGAEVRRPLATEGTR